MTSTRALFWRLPGLAWWDEPFGSRGTESFSPIITPDAEALALGAGHRASLDERHANRQEPGVSGLRFDLQTRWRGTPRSFVAGVVGAVGRREIRVGAVHRVADRMLERLWVQRRLCGGLAL